MTEVNLGLSEADVEAINRILNDRLRHLAVQIDKNKLGSSAHSAAYDETRELDALWGRITLQMRHHFTGTEALKTAPGFYRATPTRSSLTSLSSM